MRGKHSLVFVAVLFLLAWVATANAQPGVTGGAAGATAAASTTPAPAARPVAKPTVATPVMAVVPAMVATPVAAMPAAATPAPVMAAVEATAPTTAPAMEAAPVTTMEAAPTTQPTSQPVAKTEKKDSVWQTIIGGILQILLLFVAAIATALGPFLVKWISSKAKISNQETIMNMNNMYEKAVTLGVHFATQQANKLNNNPDAKSERIKWATDKAQEMIKEFGLPEKTAKWIEDAIEAKLGEKNGKKEVKAEDAVPATESEDKPKDG